MTQENASEIIYFEITINQHFTSYYSEVYDFDPANPIHH